MIHERPGVYSSYDASSVISGAAGSKVIGAAAKAVRGTVGEAVSVTGYAAGIAAFGEDAAGSPGMSELLRLLFSNGATEVTAVRTADTGTLDDYKAAFGVLELQEKVRIVVCDSPELAVQQALRDSVTASSAARKERIAVVGSSGENVSQLVTRAAALNSERVLLVGPDALDSAGETLPGVFSAAAAAGAAAAESDPAIPLNGTALSGLGGLAAAYSDSDIDTLVRGGVTPLESVGGILSPVRGITTRTTTGGAADATWREANTILIVDDVIPAIRASLRSKFTRTKNTAQNRGAIRSQIIVELEKKVSAQIIDGYGDVRVSASADNPTVCEAEFSFTVAHGLNQIRLTAHITV
ncbi:MAG: phage tail sheath subtilisin-like domain-containing protein [Oscillibacter sp.]|jgi:hypothetical protein|nr:phage tail sheath subtilisin-like domain-containing protein [Oscillibacter sp.]